VLVMNQARRGFPAGSTGATGDPLAAAASTTCGGSGIIAK